MSELEKLSEINGDNSEGFKVEWFRVDLSSYTSGEIGRAIGKLERYMGSIDEKKRCAAE